MFLFKLCLFLGLSFNALAQEKKVEGEAAYEVYSGKQDQSWEVVQQDLAALKAKLDTQATLLQNLISEKANLKGEALTTKIDEVKVEHKKYQKMVFDYNKLNEEFLTKYPERGLKEKRIYKRVKMKSLDTFEDDVTLRGKMNKLHNKIKKQYPKVFAEKKESAPVSGGTSESQKLDDKVTQPIQFKK